MEYSFKAIGEVTSCFSDKFGVPRQPRLVPSSWAKIELEPWVHPQDSLDGILEFSHVWILFVFHKNSGAYNKPKVHPPRLDGLKTGVLRQEVLIDLNPIGTSVVKIERIEGRTLYVTGVDLVTGTPVLDIKPYLPTGDMISDATCAWTEDKPNSLLEVSWSESAQNQLAKLILNSNLTSKFKNIVEECLRLDPRAIPYKAKGEITQPYGSTYGMNIENHNVVFEVTENSAQILHIEPQPFSSRGN